MITSALTLREGRMAGGAYVCKSIECFDNACKKRVFARVFRHKVDQENIDKLRGEFDGKIQV